MEAIRLNETLIRKIVHAIDKAIADDIPQYLRENRKETNNAIVQMRGDCINDNLVNLVIGGDIELVPFKRFLWNGRMLVDRANKITYTITTQKNLKSVAKKQHNNPHFLQTILHKENGDCEAPIKQMTFMDLSPFSEDVLEDDYYSIVGDLINPTEGYRHYVIAYEAENSELRDIQLEFLDRDFNIIDKASLNEYINPDFARLTDVEPLVETYSSESNEETRPLMTLKPGFRPKLQDIGKES